MPQGAHLRRRSLRQTKVAYIAAEGILRWVLLSSEEKELITGILLQIKNGNLVGLDVKKLKGRNDIFRIRKGKFRIIYRLIKGKLILLAIDKRSENTYKYL